MQSIDYTVISQNLRILLGLPLSFFSWTWWAVVHKPYKARPIVKAGLDGLVTEYASMKVACKENGLSIKELRSRLRRPDKGLSHEGHAFYFAEAWKMQGEKHWIPVQGILNF